jgi:uncharacterized membrane protein
MQMSKKVKQILNERQEEYGDAITNFTKIGIIWGTLLDVGDIEPYQVALMMDALKTVRCFDNPLHKDSWLDKQGYTQHGLEIAGVYES